MLIYEFLTGKYVDLLEKATTVKRFEYLPLSSELKKTNWLWKKKISWIKQGYSFDNEDDKIKRKLARNRKANMKNNCWILLLKKD